MNIKIKNLVSLFFVLLLINIIKGEGSASSDYETNDDSSHSGSTWSDGNGDLNSVEFCPPSRRLCDTGSYRDTNERVHLVRYCVEKDEVCCGCNSVFTPHYNVTSGNVTYVKVGECFGCSKNSRCSFDVFKDGLQRYCTSSGNVSGPLGLVILLLSLVAIII
ncbi:hypothetical protein DICPUDRAFT_97192 [Dictyostelium purpureum]|uniref:Uncharacterized protein n=1 Tax=Dictyostelium purpureum TaxID=5786 RepID=F0ZEL2_DICPU|nr:uncharacterized protein DICPUDRAFT_97192 [Dictyostelium purpureum]EGC37592.1 hypothetical protein DICPUDRAFT_97192 [Dictyostelium purpureum]|eukprot:XP_003285853.1 hypothetical protein DICPUDRAFT_97192 [Dictyostelium purpureum]